MAILLIPSLTCLLEIFVRCGKKMREPQCANTAALWIVNHLRVTLTLHEAGRLPFRPASV